MEQNSVFLEKYKQALEKKKDYLNAVQMPNLKRSFILYHSFFKTLHSILLRKGLIHEDQYKYEQKISEVSAPADTAFLESEKMEQMSIRISNYDLQLEFLNNYYQFHLDFINFVRIKNLMALVTYFRWDKFSATCQNINTQALVEMTDKIKQGSDSMSSGLIIDALSQLEKTTQEIVAVLKDSAFFHRENWKLEVRTKILPSLAFNSNTNLNQKEEIIKQIKKKIQTEMETKTVYSELLDEIIEEEFSEKADALKDYLLKKLEVREIRQKEEKEEISFRKILIEAIRFLAACNLQLEDGINKLVDNSNLLQNRKMPMLERVMRWLKKVMQGNKDQLMYELEYFDTVTSSLKTETIDFKVFITNAEKIAKLLTNYTNKQTPAFRKLEVAQEDELADLLNKHLEDVSLIHRRMAALDTYFKTEVPKEQRSKIHGVKIELNGIKNSLVKANQKKHEYVARKEEIEQMKKLGIKSTANP